MDAQPPFQPPKEFPAQRYKLAWRLLLISNLGLGAYLFAKAGKKDAAKTAQDNKKDPEVPSAPNSTTTAPIPEEVEEEPPSLPPPPVVRPMKLVHPISVDQQRELFKWMLEEKRNLKPVDSQERKQIDQDKAILKRFIHAEFLPNL